MRADATAVREVVGGPGGMRKSYCESERGSGGMRRRGAD